jgi:1,2-phenylacetyl-CoA epoxidase PaaB subunit
MRLLARSGAPLCAWLHKLQVRIFFTRFDVFVANEYKPGGCPYNTILAHENQHVAIEKEMAEFLRRETLSRLKIVEPKLSSITARTKEELESTLSSLLKPLFKGNLSVYSERRKKAQAKIDTKESYAKIQASCTDWIKHPR